MKTTKTIKKVTPNPWADAEVLELIRGELRKTLSETNKMKWELHKLAENLKKNKAKTAKLYRMVSRLEKAEKGE